MKSTLKIEEYIYPVVQDIITRQYNLTISEKSARNIVRKVIMEIDQLQTKWPVRGHFINHTLKLYCKTTKLPYNIIHQHSAYWYAKFIKHRYWFIAIPKTSFLKQLVKYLPK